MINRVYTPVLFNPYYQEESIMFTVICALIESRDTEQIKLIIGTAVIDIVLVGLVIQLVNIW